MAVSFSISKIRAISGKNEDLADFSLMFQFLYPNMRTKLLINFGLISINNVYSANGL